MQGIYNYRSTGSTVYIIFYSDGVGEDAGFQVEYKSIPGTEHILPNIVCNIAQNAKELVDGWNCTMA